MRKIAMAALLCAALGGVPQMVYAFGHPGHRLVGAVADRNLRPHALAKVREILGPGVAGLEAAAVWPDCMRDVRPGPDGAFRYQVIKESLYSNVCDPYAKNPEEVSRMEDYVRRNWDNCKTFSKYSACHTQYHFVNLAIQRSRYERSTKITGTSEVDVVSAIRAAVRYLQHPERPAPAPFQFKDAKEALMLLAHVVGDLHQPLHVGGVYLDAHGQPADPDAASIALTATLGGNLLNDAAQPGENLHHAWDSIADELKPRTNQAREDLLRALGRQSRTVPATAGTPDTWAAAWATESLLAAQTAFQGMSFTRSSGAWFFHLSGSTEDYRRLRADSQKAQVIKAGARLAQLLNGLWP